ncbi:MAG: hypothetical protein ACRYF5_17980 [Janthinobacterium lividum]
MTPNLHGSGHRQPNISGGKNIFTIPITKAKGKESMAFPAVFLEFTLSCCSRILELTEFFQIPQVQLQCVLPVNPTVCWLGDHYLPNAPPKLERVSDD